jgi:hypothetical protein
MPFSEERRSSGVFLGHQAERAPRTLHHPIGILDQSPCNGFVQGEAPSVFSCHRRHEVQSSFEAHRPGELPQRPEVWDLPAGFVRRDRRLRRSSKLSESTLRDSGAAAKEKHVIHDKSISE